MPAKSFANRKGREKAPRNLMRVIQLEFRREFFSSSRELRRRFCALHEPLWGPSRRMSFWLRFRATIVGTG